MKTSHNCSLAYFFFIIFLFFMANISVLVDIFHYRALFCPLLTFLDGVLHTVKNISSVLPGRFLFFLFGGCYPIILV